MDCFLVYFNPILVRCKSSPVYFEAFIIPLTSLLVFRGIEPIAWIGNLIIRTDCPVSSSCGKTYKPTRIMANPETSYPDRLQRGREIHAATAGFAPAFAPADADLLPAAFGTFLDGLDGLNMAVADAVSDWADSTAARTDLVKEIKARALRALARVKSNSAWKMNLPAVKAAADKLRGYRTPPPKAPEDGPPPRTRQKGDQSYADIKGLLDKLVAALKKVPAYDTGAPADISLAGLAAAATQLDGLNQLVAGKEQALAAARAPRKAAYDDDNGLKEKMLAIKEATKSQYGSKSPEFLQIKGIRV